VTQKPTAIKFSRGKKEELIIGTVFSLSTRLNSKREKRGSKTKCKLEMKENKEYQNAKMTGTFSSHDIHRLLRTSFLRSRHIRSMRLVMLILCRIIAIEVSRSNVA